MKKARSFRLAIIVPWILASIFLFTPLNGQDLSQPIVYSVPGMDKVEVRPNLIYKRDGRDEMKMDIYIPAGLI